MSTRDIDSLIVVAGVIALHFYISFEARKIRRESLRRIFDGNDKP